MGSQLEGTSGTAGAQQEEAQPARSSNRQPRRAAIRCRSGLCKRGVSLAPTCGARSLSISTTLSTASATMASTRRAARCVCARVPAVRARTGRHCGHLRVALCDAAPAVRPLRATFAHTAHCADQSEPAARRRHITRPRCRNRGRRRRLQLARPARHGYDRPLRPDARAARPPARPLCKGEPRAPR
eukprot:1035313-Prymnesium_polylepis.1